MKQFVRKTLQFLDYVISFFLYYSGFLYLYSKTRLKRRITIVFYHEVGDSHGVLGTAAVSPHSFEKQIRYMKRFYNWVSLGELHSYFNGAKRLPPNPLIVTFDGGFIGNYTHAYPILKKNNIPATIYLVTEYIEKQETPWRFRLRYIVKHTSKKSFTFTLPGFEKTYRLNNSGQRTSCAYDLGRYLTALPPEERERAINDIARELSVPLDGIPSNLFLTPSEIERMNREGLIEFGSHTLSHPSLINLTAEEAGTEILESKEKIEAMTGTEVTSFCYPYGHFSNDTKALVAQAGYRSATTTRFGLNAENIDPIELKRVGIRDLPLCVFAAELSGVYRSGTMSTWLNKIKRSVGGRWNGSDNE